MAPRCELLRTIGSDFEAIYDGDLIDMPRAALELPQDQPHRVVVHLPYGVAHGIVVKRIGRARFCVRWANKAEIVTVFLLADTLGKCAGEQLICFRLPRASDFDQSR